MKTSRLFHLEMPSDLVKAVEACEDDKQARQVGIDWCIQQCRELTKAGVPGLHFYTMGKSDNIVKIAREIFWPTGRTNGDSSGPTYS